jgi:hypothetical protein
MAARPLHLHRVLAAAIAHDREHGHPVTTQHARTGALLVMLSQTRQRNGMTGRTIAADIS